MLDFDLFDTFQFISFLNTYNFKLFFKKIVLSKWTNKKIVTWKCQNVALFACYIPLTGDLK